MNFIVFALAEASNMDKIKFIETFIPDYIFKVRLFFSYFIAWQLILRARRKSKIAFSSEQVLTSTVISLEFVLEYNFRFRIFPAINVNTSRMFRSKRMWSLLLQISCDFMEKSMQTFFSFKNTCYEFMKPGMATSITILFYAGCHEKEFFNTFLAKEFVAWCS